MGGCTTDSSPFERGTGGKSLLVQHGERRLDQVSRRERPARIIPAVKGRSSVRERERGEMFTIQDIR